MMNNKEFWHKAARAVGIDSPGGDHSIHDDGRVWDCKNLRWVLPEELKTLVLNALSTANQRIAEQAEEIAKAQADAKWNRDLWKKSEDKADALYLENKKLRAYKEECEKAEAVAWMMPTVPVRIVDHPNFNANYGGAVTPLYTRPSPDLQKKVEELEAEHALDKNIVAMWAKENEELNRKLAVIRDCLAKGQ